MFTVHNYCILRFASKLFVYLFRFDRCDRRTNNNKKKANVSPKIYDNFNLLNFMRLRKMHVNRDLNVRNVMCVYNNEFRIKKNVNRSNDKSHENGMERSNTFLE